jgi:hypothetical protein
MPPPLQVETVDEDSEEDREGSDESGDLREQLSEDREESHEFGDLRDQLRSEQKPGIAFPHDSCLPKDLAPDLEAITLTQYNLKRGLKEFGNDGLVALGKEMEQLHTRVVAKPIDGHNLTSEQKRATLRYLMFLSKKQCGRVKARGCANGRKQRETTDNEDMAKRGLF